MTTEEFINYSNSKLNSILYRKRIEEKLRKEKNMNSNGDVVYSICNVRGHYEVYKNGKFYCSADTYGEAVKEIPS